MDTNRKQTLHTPRRAGGLSVLLTLAALVCLLLAFAATANAETVASGYCGGEGSGSTYGHNLTWQLDSNGTLSINGTGKMGQFTQQNVPWREYREKINELSIQAGVTTISSNAFRSCDNIITVVLPESIDEIGSSAFAYCKNLISVDMPQTASYLGSGAFSGCTSLKAVRIPDGITEVGNSLFFECFSLAEVELPSTIKSIETLAFDNCNSLSTLILPDGLTTIKDRAFLCCAGLTNIVIPKAVTSIGFDAFYKCINLKSAFIYGNIEKIPTTMFEECTALERVVLSESITEIGVGAFKGCTNLIDINLPNTITEIGSEAFMNCTSLREIQLPAELRKFDSSIFKNCSSLNSLIIPDKATGTVSLSSCTGLTSIVIGDSITQICSLEKLEKLGTVTIGKNVSSIDSCAFRNCISLTSIVLPDSVVKIERNAFDGCKSLSVVDLGKGLSSIGREAFYGCTELTSISIPDGVEDIPYGTFASCNKLKTIVLPDSVSSIGEIAFLNCSSLTSISLPANLQAIGDRAFSGCSALSGNLQLPRQLVSIGNGAFYNCHSLSGDLIIPDSVTTIGNSAFYECNGFTGSLTIPNSVTTIGYSAFYGCSGFIGSLTILGSVTAIDNYTFYGCSGFTGNLTIPESVTSIGNSAFSRCSGFTGILTIPEGVTSIGRSAFDSCSGFTGSLIIPSSVTTIDSCAFDSCSGFTGSLTIPEGVTTIGRSAFDSCSGFTGSLTIPSSVTTIDSCAFSSCSGFTGNLTIPDGITEIKGSTFDGCSGLTSITISDSVNAIGTYAFSRISAKVYFYGDAPSENRSFSDSTTLYYISGKAGWTSPTWHGYKTEIWDPDAAFFEDGWIAVQIFDGLSSDGTKVSCDKGMYAYPIVSETDRSFMEQLDALTGKYVLVKLDHDEQLLAIRPVTSFVAEAEAATEDSITFMGVQYPRFADEVFWEEYYLGYTFLVHLYNGRAVGLERLQPLSGRLNSWDEAAGSVTVDNTVYPVNYLVGENFWNEISAQQGQYVGFYLGMDWVYGYGKPYLFRVSPLTGKSFIRLYASSQLMELASGESLDIFCELFRNDVQAEDWSTPAITVSDGSVLRVSSYKMANGGIAFKVTGTGTGVSTLTVSDSVSGAYAAIPITVGAERSQTLSYRMDAIPDFKPGVWGDEYTQTNFYNIAGMCINNYRYQRPNKPNGKYSVSFDVYNFKYMHGAVDIYNSDGKWIESRKIEKQTGISSISQTFESAFYLIADFANGQAFSYMSSTQSQKTHISIDVPDGGYFTISTNYAQSPGCLLYNAADYIFEAANTAITISTNGIESIEKALETSLKDAIAEKAIWDSFMSQMQSNSMKMLQSASTFSIGASVGAVTQTSVDVLKSIGIDWVSVVKNATKIDEGALMKILEMGPPGKALSIAFKISKYVDLTAQTIQICGSLNNRIITIHTPDQNSRRTTVQGVSVEAPEDAVESGAVLQVFRVNASNADEPLPEESSIESYDVYNICFVKDGQESQLHGKVTVRIPKPAGFKGSTCQVWRQESDGSWTPITAVVEENYLVFETDHFSLYAVAVPALSAEYLGEELVISGYIPRLPDTFGTALLALYDGSGKLLRVANADELQSGSELAVSQRFNDLPNVAFAKLFLLTQEHRPASAAITAELQ